LKRVLITGADSFVGTSVEKWLMKEPNEYHIETLDMKNPNWRKFDFSMFDVVFHVAGIAHVSTKKSMDNIYYSVNRDLAIETAYKAKESGVKQFIFMSSSIIYGDNGSLMDKKPINKNTFNPQNAYGKSKLDADLTILNMNDKEFKCVIIRTPVIYGINCKGNIPKLLNIAKYAVFFPNIKNIKSMIYIDFLSDSVKHYIDNKLSGVFFPQNPEYISTKEIIKIAREFYGKKYRETKIFNLFIYLISPFSTTIKKIFGNKFFELDEQYFSHELSIKETLLRTMGRDSR